MWPRDQGSYDVAGDSLSVQASVKFDAQRCYLSADVFMVFPPLNMGKIFPKKFFKKGQTFLGKFMGGVLFHIGDGVSQMHFPVI